MTKAEASALLGGLPRMPRLLHPGAWYHVTARGIELGRKPRPPVAWEEVIRAVEQGRGERWEDFKDKHGHRGRDQVLHLARRATGLTVSELAQKTGPRQGENVSMAVQRYQKLITENEPERQLAARVAEMLFVML